MLDQSDPSVPEDTRLNRHAQWLFSILSLKQGDLGKTLTEATLRCVILTLFPVLCSFIESPGKPRKKTNGENEN